jgi:4-amino-4-deoxy-L-arabinose transferase-like glycosyltransferase
MSALGLLGHWQLHPEPVSDELDIIRPAFDYISGQIATNVKYPSFSYYFYGSFFALAGTLHDELASLAVARCVNIGIFVCNLLLYYACARSYLSRNWAATATTGLWATPWVLFTGLTVKTEALQLACVLLSLLALQKLDAHPRQRRWLVLASAAAALAISTKLNGLPLVMLLLYVADRTWRKAAPFTRWDPLVCGVTFVVVLLSSWTNLWVFPEIMSRVWHDDLYFHQGAVAFSAVSEPLAFPYDRFGSFLVTTLPLSLGCFAVLWLGAVYFRSGGARLHTVFGGATLLMLVLALLSTRMRLPHGFTAYSIYFHLSAFCFVRDVMAGGSARRPWLKRIGSALVASALVLQLVHTVEVVPRTAEGFIRYTALMGRDVGSTKLYAVFRSPREGDTARLRQLVDDQRPRYIYVSNAYFSHLAKYRDNAVYRDNRAFYAALMNGELPYRLVQRVAFPFALAFLSPDPELRDPAFYLFERRRGNPG